MLNSQLQQIKDNFNTYDKPHLTFAKQLQRLKDNGLSVHNDAYAIKKLSHVNYYRLSAYFLPFQFPKDSDNVDKFFEGTQFREIIKLYDFDAIGEEVDFLNEVKQLMAQHTELDFKAMGFVDGWENTDIWSDV